jgi:hypothetical protein
VPRFRCHIRSIYESVGGVERKKEISISAETESAVKGARRAFISTLDSTLRLTELKWERSETKFSEASFLRGLSFSLLFLNACKVALTRARL